MRSGTVASVNLIAALIVALQEDPCEASKINVYSSLAERAESARATAARFLEEGSDGMRLDRDTKARKDIQQGSLPILRSPSRGRSDLKQVGRPSRCRRIMGGVDVLIDKPASASVTSFSISLPKSGTRFSPSIYRSLLRGPDRRPPHVRAGSGVILQDRIHQRHRRPALLRDYNATKAGH